MGEWAYVPEEWQKRRGRLEVDARAERESIDMERASNVKILAWCVERKSTVDEQRLFIFHHAGGGATYYMPMLKNLSHRISVYLVQLPGREFRLKEPAYDNWETLLQEVTEAIRPYLDRPFAFFGHSMGAIVSYELTHRLKKAYGLAPRHLLLSALSAPHISRNQYGNLPDEELLEKMSGLGGTDSNAAQDKKLMAVILPTLRQDLRLCDCYRQQAHRPLDIPATILGGDEDQAVGVETLLEWDRYFSNTFEVCLFQGNHFYFKNQYVLLAEIIMKAMGQNAGE